MADKDKKEEVVKIKKEKYKLIKDVSIGGEIKKKGTYVFIGDATAIYFKRQNFI